MKSKTNWLFQIGTAGMTLALSVMPGNAQNVRISRMQFSFTEAGDPARDLYNNGKNFYDNNKFGDAELVFKQVLKKYPRNEVAAAASYYLMKTLAKQGKNEE